MKPVKEDPQGIGSLISYARRYALQAMVMVCPEDDDGELAMGRTATQKPVESSKPITNSQGSIPDQVAKRKALEDDSKNAVTKHKFNGKSHQQLFQKLMENGITQEDFMATMRYEKQIPEQATDFFAMKETTAEKFLGEINTIKGVVLKWIALYKK